MNWRTDKPTADVIVAEIKDRGYKIMYASNADTNYYLDDNGEEFSYTEFVKWADLEEENYKTTYPNTDFDKKVAEFKQQLINKKAIVNYKDADPFVGIYWTELLETMHSFGQWGLDQFNYSKDETVTDCDELKEEIDRAIDDLEGVAEKDADGVLIAHLTLIENLKDFARHFAKWGAEHRDRFLNWIRDLIKKGIEKPEEALNILKRIDALINDDSLWGEHLKK